MKLNRDAVALAASLTSAANTPLPLPKPQLVAETSGTALPEPLRGTEDVSVKGATKMGSIEFRVGSLS